MDEFSLYYKLFPEKYLLNNLELTDFSKAGDVNEESFIWARELIYRINRSNNRDMKMLYFNRLNNLLLKAIDEIFIEEPKEEIINFPIKRLNGITCSKSDGYKNFHEFAFSLKTKDYFKSKIDLITFETEQDFQDNINSINRRFTPEYVFTLYYQSWNDKYYLSNEDQSHHLAAIYRQCYEQNKEYSLKCKIDSYRINPISINYINSNYYSYLYHCKSRSGILDYILFKMNVPAAHLTDCYNFEDDNYYYVFIPIKHKYSKVINSFLKNNSSLFYDLNEYFYCLL